ncbi:hypothetical protein FNL55_12305 [Tardiphaga sp. vice352]|uniref:hypothetical protein n=1 Tax=unclassified Tardiphaga TaxID=2631404 RepID=UPI0011656C35|nr:MULTISPECIES: hypothetical protein [unclassified Tardiphaga]MBC7623389.1 hypothetical protein [Burkholderiales bacterium]QDM16749.1 hypothetical protein FNL53_13020 [Tardiphaga sp. vice278]QDM32023.1 hypothetical protein FNL55_12305 [Tardiphaga sp. vice352]
MTTNSTPHASIKPAFTVTSRLGETEATSSIVLVFPFFGRESRILFSMETITTLVENLKIIINRKRVGGIQMFTDQDEFLYLSKSNERIRIQLNRESNGGDYAQELIEVTTLPVSMVPEMLLAIRQEIGCVLRNFYTDEEDKEESFWANHNAFLQKENERLNKTAIENKNGTAH